MKINPIEIKAYLEQKMPSQEREAFEERLDREEALRVAVNDYRQLFDGFEQMQWLERQQNVARWNQQADKEALNPEMIDQELISLYYSGELNEALKTNFEERLKKEPVFAQKLADYKTVFEGMDLLQRQEIEQKVRKLSIGKGDATTDTQAIMQPVMGQANAPQAKRRRLLPIGLAAVLTAGLIFGWLSWWATQTEGSTLEAFLSEKYEAPINLIERGGETTMLQEGAYAQGIKAYHANLSKESIAAFEKVSPEDDQYLQSQYYIAHSWYQLKQYQQSFEAFTLIGEQLSNSSYFKKGIGSKNGVEWNRILALSQVYRQSQEATDKKQLDSILATFISKQKKGKNYYKDAMDLKAFLEKE